MVMETASRCMEQRNQDWEKSGMTSPVSWEVMLLTHPSFSARSLLVMFFFFTLLSKFLAAQMNSSPVITLLFLTDHVSIERMIL